MSKIQEAQRLLQAGGLEPDKHRELQKEFTFLPFLILLNMDGICYQSPGIHMYGWLQSQSI